MESWLVLNSSASPTAARIDGRKLYSSLAVGAAVLSALFWLTRKSRATEPEAGAAGMFRELDKTPSAEQLAAVFEEVLSVPDAPPDVAPTPGGVFAYRFEENVPAHVSASSVWWALQHKARMPQSYVDVIVACSVVRPEAHGFVREIHVEPAEGVHIEVEERVFFREQARQVMYRELGGKFIGMNALVKAGAHADGADRWVIKGVYVYGEPRDPKGFTAMSANTVRLLLEQAALLPRTWFVLAGQSNMAGRDQSQGPPQPNKHIWAWRQAEGEGAGSEQWQPLRGWVHEGVDALPLRQLAVPQLVARGWDPAVGDGPDISLSAAILSHIPTGRSIGLLPTSVGASGIDAWSEGGPLYDNMIEQTRRAARASGAPPTAIVFYQGETDATREELAAAYADKLDAFVLAARTDLSLPDLPVVVVALAGNPPSHPSRLKFMSKVHEAQMGAAQRSTNVVVVDAGSKELGLAMMADGIHVDGDSQRKLGNELASALIKANIC